MYMRITRNPQYVCTCHLVAACGCYISPDRARDCADIQDLGFNSSGVYQIYPGNIRNGLKVFCDMETDGGGWLVK